MVSNLLKQPYRIKENLSTAVKRLMKEKGLTQADLTRRSGLSKTIVSRIVRNTNDKGGYYTPTMPVIMMLGVGFSLSSIETKSQLFYAAFPEMEIVEAGLDELLSIDSINAILDNNALSLLGSNQEE